MTQYADTYELVVGLEIHIQLNTQSKLFAPESHVFGQLPNTQTSVVSLAYPGTLPRLNRQALVSALRLALACNCAIQPRLVFDRKNYFYPDLPKGYQISQDKEPIAQGGILHFWDSQGDIKTLPLHHFHLEEDAGKSIHPENAAESHLDFNRAGVPLIEMVTEPVIHASETALQLLYAVRRLVRFLGISDGNMEEGSLRCDANVSVRPHGSSRLGTRVEIKNLNSARNVKKAIEYEFVRQCELLAQGQHFSQETRAFDAELGRTRTLRQKESLHDYRYFPDPDLPPFLIKPDWIAAIQAEMPTLPHEWLYTLRNTYGLPASEAVTLAEEPEALRYFEEAARHTPLYAELAHWLNNELRALQKETGLLPARWPLRPKVLAELLTLVASQKVSRLIAQHQLLPQLWNNPAHSLADLIQDQHLAMEDNSAVLQNLIQEILLAWPDKVKAYKKGKKGLLGFFMGEIQKRTQGKAHPSLAQQLLAEALDSSRY
ncbi:MAG: Asp-tRNA(Asn)/Glu-tRNA(Gln) amidotransferase subunit GatB [Microscillaceae bacterium]|nr:Asp-tRNA(Asn)/Glu-tRNA(Gln) amidotransferase subunit GatB [Microscillaceae bacterium]